MSELINQKDAADHHDIDRDSFSSSIPSLRSYTSYSKATEPQAITNGDSHFLAATPASFKTRSNKSYDTTNSLKLIRTRSLRDQIIDDYKQTLEEEAQ